MTSDDMWRVVGRELREVRERQPGETTVAFFAHRAGVDVNTIKAIERGNPGTRTKLEAYAGALGLSIVDVLSATLKAAEQRPTPEAAALLRCFEHLPVEDRRLLLESAQRLLSRHEALAQLEARVAAFQSTAPRARGRRPKAQPPPPKSVPPREP